MEQLGHMVNALVENGCWNPMTFARNGTKLAHLCFANDIILFARADIEQAMVIRNCLETYSDDARQHVSLEKSSLVVSRNVPHALAEALSSKLGIL